MPVTEAAFCGACGKAVTETVHERCPERLRFDPPRFCGDCGVRQDVQVYPDGVDTWCRRCAPGARKAR